MRALVVAAAALVATAAIAAGSEPAQSHPDHNEAVCSREKGLCIVNMEDLAEQQALLVAATKRVKELEEELAAEKARKTKRCAVVIPQRNTAVR